MYRNLARVVCVIHLASVAMIVLGLPAVYFFHKYRQAHTLLVLGTMLQWRIFGGCLFTIWEKQLLAKTIEGPYDADCVVHYCQRACGLRLPQWFTSSSMCAILAVSTLLYLGLV